MARAGRLRRRGTGKRRDGRNARPWERKATPSDVRPAQKLPRLECESKGAPRIALCKIAAVLQSLQSIPTPVIAILRDSSFAGHSRMRGAEKRYRPRAGGPELVRIDLKANKVAQVIRFDDTVAPQGSYLKDMGFSSDGRHASGPMLGPRELSLWWNYRPARLDVSSTATPASSRKMMWW